MGGFILSTKGSGHPDEIIVKWKKARLTFRDRNQKAVFRFENEDSVFELFAKSNRENSFSVHQYQPDNPQSDFVAIVGTWFYDNHFGNEAIERLAQDYLISNESVTHKMKGHFCIISCIKGVYQFTLDIIGIYKVYYSNDNCLFSNSFHATLLALQSKTISKHEFYEYIFNKANFGNRTFIKEIFKLTGRNIYTFSHKKLSIKSFVPKSYSFASISPKDRQIEFLEKFSKYFELIGSRYSKDIACPHTGGYDSRLMLCFLRKIGIQPRVFVSGSDNSIDVRISENIARSEGFTLHRLRPSAKLKSEEYVNYVQKNLIGLDAYGGMWGIFNVNDQLRDKQMNAVSNTLLLHGMGGEILRNFFNLPDKKIRLSNFSVGYYDRIFSEQITPLFSVSEYLSNIIQKIQLEFKIKESVFSRDNIELIYSFMNLQCWAGQNMTLNNYYADSLGPLTEWEFSSLASKIPIREKLHGRYEAALIYSADSALAQYESSYGYSFCPDAVPWKTNFKNLLIQYTPNEIRPFLRKFRVSRNKKLRPYYDSPDYVGQFFDSKDLLVSEYVHLDKIMDPDVLSRAYTVEYLMRIS